MRAVFITTIIGSVAACSSSPDLRALPTGDAGTDSAEVATPAGDASDASDSAPRGDASDGSDALDLCAFLSGRSFKSPGQSVCGVAPDGGVYYCSQLVFFNTDGTCLWTHGDTGESGTYSCLGLTITVIPYNSPTFMATYDPSSGTLNWYNGPYQLE